MSKVGNRVFVLMYRNNLTVVDAVVVQGQGAREEFTLNGKKPGLHSTLLFELKPSHLSDCHSEYDRFTFGAPMVRTGVCVEGVGGGALLGKGRGFYKMLPFHCRATVQDVEGSI